MTYHKHFFVSYKIYVLSLPECVNFADKYYTKKILSLCCLHKRTACNDKRNRALQSIKLRTPDNWAICVPEV